MLSLLKTTFSSEREGHGVRDRFTDGGYRISQRANTNDRHAIRILSFALIVGWGSFQYCFNPRRVGGDVTPVSR